MMDYLAEKIIWGTIVWYPPCIALTFDALIKVSSTAYVIVEDLIVWHAVWLKNKSYDSATLFEIPHW